MGEKVRKKRSYILIEQYNKQRVARAIMADPTRRTWSYSIDHSAPEFADHIHSFVDILVSILPNPISSS